MNENEYEQMNEQNKQTDHGFSEHESRADETVAPDRNRDTDPYDRGEESPQIRDQHIVDPVGHSYTTPDGSHGFIYSHAATEDRAWHSRGVWVAISVMAITTLVLAVCFVGALMAADKLGPFDRTPTVDADGGLDTSGGLLIDDGTQTDVAETLRVPTIGSNVVLPSHATIIKNAAQRIDADHDGKADIAYDTNGHVLTSAGDGILPVPTVVDKVSASVVEITTETQVQSGYIGQYITSGAGSGVVIAEEGYIITNHHVIDGANTITVRMSDGKEFAAMLVGSDPETDIAVLWINAEDYPLTVATMGASYDLVVGEDILAIGNPLGSLGGTVTEGMVSATARDITVSGTAMTLLQISAPINPGNSGGGLFNLAGELVGIVNAKMSSEELEGLGFAIPSDTAYPVICEIIEYGHVRGRPALGVTLTEVTDLRGNRSVRVSGNDHSILRDQDRIGAADGVEISSIEDLSAIVYSKSVGDTVELTVYRDGRWIQLTVPIIERGSQG